MGFFSSGAALYSLKTSAVPVINSSCVDQKVSFQGSAAAGCCHCLLLFSPCKLPLHLSWDPDKRYLCCSSVVSFQNNHLNNPIRESAAAPLLLAVLNLSQWKLSRSRVSSWQTCNNNICTVLQKLASISDSEGVLWLAFQQKTQVKMLVLFQYFFFLILFFRVTG